MTFELVNTSVPKGLRDRVGFTNVVVTEGLPPGLEPLLEELSAYDIETRRPGAGEEIDWCHRIVTVQGRSFTVLSRIAACGADWTGRPNRIAHHLVLDVHDRARAGPAWVLARFPGFAAEAPPVERRIAGPDIPQGQLEPRIAAAWERAGFDPGWAGVLGTALLDGGGAATYLVLPSLVDALDLLEDVFALLPEERRWTVTFSTRFARVPTSTRCQLRCVRQGAPGLAVLLAEPGCRVVTPKPGVSAGESPGAVSARAGHELKATQRAVSARIEPRLLDTPVQEERRVVAPLAGSGIAPGSVPHVPASPPSDPDAPGTVAARRQGSGGTARDGRRMAPLDVFLFLWAIGCLVASLFVLAIGRT